MQNSTKTIHGAWNDAPTAVTLIDAHHHLWQIGQNKHPSLRGPQHATSFIGDNTAIRRDYLPDDYRRDAAGHNVLTTVHCEAEWERDDQVGETRWVNSLHERFGLPGAIVAHAWFDTPNAEEIIAAQAAFPLVRGIRSKPVTAPSPDKMTRGAPGTMQDDKWLRGFALLDKYKLSWDLRVPFWHLEEAAAVARAFPKTPIILNHTGFPWDRSEEGLAAWRRGMAALAREGNVWVKVSEFGMKDRAWNYEENRRIVLETVAIFGIERSVFATNFPVASLKIGYDALVEAMSRMLADRSPQDRDKFFWRNAAAFYRLQPSAGESL